MAKLVNPLLSASARGKGVAGIYNVWRGIAYLKRFTSPSQPRTAPQLAARALLVSFVEAWKELSDLQRSNWDTWAAAHLRSDWTGQPVRITGQNAFIACNVNSARMGGTAISNPPTAAAPDAPTGFALSVASGAIKAAWSTPSSPSIELEFRIQGPYSVGAKGSYPRSAFLTHVHASSTSPHTLVASAAAGKYTVWMRSVDPASGLTSLWVSDDVVVTE